MNKGYRQTGPIFRLAAILGLFFALTLVALLKGTRTEQPAPQKSSVSPQGNADQAISSTNPSSPALPAPIHHSLLGTEVNGEIRLNSDGSVELHRDIRRLFDYFLSLRGRQSDAEIRQQLIDFIKNSNSRSGLLEVLAMFDRYVGLLAAETKLAEQNPDKNQSTAAGIEDILQERRQLRREYLSPELAEVFYQDQESYENYQLERLRIGRDPNLSAAEKNQALAEAETILSPEQREIRQQTFSYLQVKQAQAEGSKNEEATNKLIEEKFGSDALDRRAQAKQEKLDWDMKRQEYLAERARINQRTDLTPADKKQALTRYSQERFSPAEIRRMDALDSDSDTLLGNSR